jgi:hypothetical protein
MVISIPLLLWQGRTQLSWICTCFLPCLTAIVHTCNGSPTKSCLSIGFGRQLKAFGVTQFRQRLPGHSCLYHYLHPTVTINKYNPNLYLSPNARSFVLAYRIMKLMITEQGNNAWLAHGTLGPILLIRKQASSENKHLKNVICRLACYRGLLSLRCGIFMTLY